MILWMDC